VGGLQSVVGWWLLEHWIVMGRRCGMWWLGVGGFQRGVASPRIRRCLKIDVVEIFLFLMRLYEL
jgi:hypothetical protein